MNIQVPLCAAALLGVCSVSTYAAPVQDAKVPKTPAASILFDGMDRSVVPGDDFYSYANGGWLKGAEIPADRASYGVWETNGELNEHRVADLIREIAPRGATADAESRKIADYYASFMNEASVEARGLAGLRASLDRISAITDRAALARYLGSTLRADVDVLNATRFHTDHIFGLWVAQDLDNPSRYLPFLLQGGLGMPDRDYYLNPSPTMVEHRTQYQSYIAALLKLSGEHNPDPAAAAIFALEHRIAEVHESLQEAEDVKQGDNHWTREQLIAHAPGLDWAAFLEGAGLSHQNDFVVWQPAAITGIAALVGSEPIQTWKAYLTFQELNHFAAFLPKAYVDARFEFFGKDLSGVPVNRERWKRAVAATNAALGDAVGKLYVQKYFPPESKTQIDTLVRNLIAAFTARIDTLQWMAPATKTQAKAKLAALKVGVGYPDHWRDYSGLDVRADDALGNAQRSELFEYQWNLSKLGHPVDRSEWVMVPQTVDAVNLPAINALNFPAAMLQAPFFDPKQPASLNYGGIGAVIGHEISHSFDSTGALFDATGRLHNWWSDADFAHFRAASQQLARQFDSYKPFPDASVNGTQTLGEDIADVAGLLSSYNAYHLSLHGKSDPLVQGLSDDQQFFVAYAQIWRTKTRDSALRQELVTDPHAPEMYRPLTCRNLDAWYAAFNVKPGEKLYLAPDQRVRMW